MPLKGNWCKTEPMIRSKHFIVALLGILCSSVGAIENGGMVCLGARLGAAAPDSSELRKYAPDRAMDILHLALDVTPDFQKRTIAGKMTLKFKPIAKPLREITLDAVDLEIGKVDSAEAIQGYQATGQKLIVTFSKAIPAGEERALTVEYRCQPKMGLYFRTPEMGYKPGDTHLFTQGEDIEARHWFPSHDYPNEKFTSEIVCRVPEGMVALANGKLISQEKEAGTGLVAFRWLQDKPHVSYLISLVAGNLKKVEDTYKDIPLAFYTPASEIDLAQTSFKDTKDMMGFFEKEIGVPYPWAKYYQVCVNDFMWGGMENTSITTLTDHTLFTDASENIRSSEDLVSHELAHQWFGDLVTCKDWSHLWLNEGFATYYAHLYDGHKNGHDQFLYGLYQSARGFLGRGAAEDNKPMVYRKFDNPTDLFGYLIYPRGAWVLHMLRGQLGEDLYRKCIQTYLERNQYGSVVTANLSQVIEEFSGQSYDQFFDQWVYHAHHPELSVNYSWDEKTKLAKLTIRQNQPLSEDVLLFNFPLQIRFKSGGTAIDREITVKEKEEDFYFPLPQAPASLRLDPNYHLLARISFTPPRPMLLAQLEDKTDVIGRVLAVEQLGKGGDHDSVERLKKILQTDPFHGVRIEAANALKAMHRDEALEALLAGQEQADARVRQVVAMAVGSFYDPKALAFAKERAAKEKNPDILHHHILALAADFSPETGGTLVRYLHSQSFQNLLADAAISAMKSRNDPAQAQVLLEHLRTHESEFTSGGFGRALEALASLAKDLEKREEVREFLVSKTTSPVQRVQLAALSALGTLQDPKAIPVLEKFAAGSRDTPQRAPAERSIGQLRAGRKPADDLQTVRGEVTDLKNQNREMTKTIEELKRKLEALSARDGKSGADAKPAKAPLKRSKERGAN